MPRSGFLRYLSLPAIAAIATFVLIVIRAMRTVDQYWDTLAYHWAFAARAAGICDRDCFVLPAVIEARYDGFPKLLYFLQGVLWRVTGTPGMADLIGIATLAALCLYLWRRFAVPLAWSWLAFLAIPIVQIHLTSTYIDLPVNAAVTLALMALLRMLAEPDAPQRFDVALALGALAFAAGSKYQMVPVAVLIWSVIVLLGTRNPARIGMRRRGAAFIVLGLAGMLALLPTLAANTLAYGNPVYPIALAVGPIRFPGPEAMPINSISDAWVATPGPVRWLASVMEYDAFRGRPVPWTIDQGDVQQNNPSFRMGGYFVPYVLGLIGILVWSARTAPKARGAATMVALLSLLSAAMPNSHELRYYMYWMLALVAITLAVVHAPAFASDRQPLQRDFARGLVAVAAASVVLMTGGAYLRTHGDSLQDLLQGTDATVAQVPDGGTLCVRDSGRYALFYSSAFHAGRHYRTRSLAGDDAGPGCALNVSLDR